MGFISIYGNNKQKWKCCYAWKKERDKIITRAMASCVVNLCSCSLSLWNLLERGMSSGEQCGHRHFPCGLTWSSHDTSSILHHQTPMYNLYNIYTTPSHVLSGCHDFKEIANWCEHHMSDLFRIDKLERLKNTLTRS